MIMLNGNVGFHQKNFLQSFDMKRYLNHKKSQTIYNNNAMWCRKFF